MGDRSPVHPKCLVTSPPIWRVDCWTYLMVVELFSLSNRHQLSRCQVRMTHRNRWPDAAPVSPLSFPSSHLVEADVQICFLRVVLVKARRGCVHFNLKVCAFKSPVSSPNHSMCFSVNFIDYGQDKLLYKVSFLLHAINIFSGDTRCLSSPFLKLVST